MLRNQFDEVAVAVDPENEMTFLLSDQPEEVLFEQYGQEKEEIDHLLFEDRPNDVYVF